MKVFLKSNQTSKAKPTILDHYAAAQGLGAFEVILVEKGKLREGYMDEVTVLYSKIKDKNWPRISYVLKKLSNKMPKSTLIVQLYDDDETKVTEDERGTRF